MKNSRAIGASYESEAAKYLQNKKYQILERNYRNSFGEIDLIALSPDRILCYVEIKYRSTLRCGAPMEAVDARKQKKISKVASMHYSYKGRYYSSQCRFDVIGIYGDGTVVHIENAFDFQ